MKRVSSIALICLLGYIVSCKRVDDGDVTPDQLSQLSKCPLKGITTSKGTPFNSFEYTLGRIKRIINYDSLQVASTFTYNAKNQIEKMVIEDETSNSEKYTVLYVYDASSGKIVKTKTSIKDFEFMTNDFVYSGDNIKTIQTTFNVFGSKVVGTTKVEYVDENVSKVYTKIDGYPELLTFEGVGYDTKPQFYPAGYKTMALGFVGIANNFFAFFGKNNATLVKIYDDNGKLDETTQIDYEYNKSGFPTKAVQTLTKSNVKTTQGLVFTFMCN